MKEDRKGLCADMMPFYVEDFRIQRFLESIQDGGCAWNKFPDKT